MPLLVLFPFQNPFSSVRTLKLIKTMLKSLHVMLGFRYQKGSHTTGATTNSIIAHGKIEDRIGKEWVPDYHLVY